MLALTIGGIQIAGADMHKLLALDACSCLRMFLLVCVCMCARVRSAQQCACAINVTCCLSKWRHNIFHASMNGKPSILPTYAHVP